MIQKIILNCLMMVLLLNAKGQEYTYLKLIGEFDIDFDNTTLIANHKIIEPIHALYKIDKTDSISLLVISKGYKKIDTVLSAINDTLRLQLSPEETELNTLTVTGQRYGVKVSNSIASIEVILPTTMLNQGIQSMDEALNRVPGVNMIDNQMSIRGGDGWSYGAGSRVLVLVDDIPMISADANDIKWNLLPIENCTQVEVLKGAASGIYGSSAMNGVVNFRTAFAEKKPITKAQLYSGIYSNPPDQSWKWWTTNQPYNIGGYFAHSQKVNRWDLVFGMAGYSQYSYLEGANEKRFRINGNVRYQFPNNRILLGVNYNIQTSKFSNFIFWDKPNDSTTLYLQPYGGLVDSTSTINITNGNRYLVDPYANFYLNNNDKISFRNRWFRVNNTVPSKTDRTSKSDIYFSELMYNRNFRPEQLQHMYIGIVQTHMNVTGNLYGNHKQQNLAFYLQFDKQWKSTSLSMGGRIESNKIDHSKWETRPVFRLGFNSQLSFNTYIRGSWGQGYRYPSIAERFTQTSFGASKVLPNANLQSETGWTADIGLKQLFKINKIQFFFDASLYYMKYQNMMEFNFGLHLPKDSTAQQLGWRALEYIGFQSVNVGNTKIWGADFSLHGTVNYGRHTSMQTTLGYTYSNPVYLSPDSAVLSNISDLLQPPVLKYRYVNTVKWIIDFDYKRWSLGATLLYNSFMINIDEVLVNTRPQQNLYGYLFDQNTNGLSTSIRNFRSAHHSGNVILDSRLHYSITKEFRIGFIIKNISNHIYMTRPGTIAPLRNWSIQLDWNI